jgi:hypothetical protein
MEETTDFENGVVHIIPKVTFAATFGQERSKAEFVRRIEQRKETAAYILRLAS